jgi:branched-chain amino acid transport system permease protein
VPLRDPGSYRDKSADWLDFFARARRRELSGLITPDLIREHCEDPRGGESRHSAALQDVLNYLHNQPMDGKAFVYASVPYQKYYLGTMRVRGTAPTIMTDREFSDEREAVHALFIRRLESLGLIASADEGDGR